MSWASPDGLIMHAAQPILADGLRRSGVGEGAEWGASLLRVLDDPRSVSSFQQGFREGVWNGAKSLVEGAWGLVKSVGEIAYDKNLLGERLDLLRRGGIAVPDWAPSADRVDARMQAIGDGVGRYLSEVGRNPAKLGDDVKGWIGANWDALKADHANAATQGGAAEAQWWGQIAGRATFEVAAVAVPVTKFATVAKAGEALNVALKAGKLSDALADAARAGKLFELAGAAIKAGKMPELIAEARQAGRLGELAAEARKAPDGLKALAGEGGITGKEAKAAGGTLAADIVALRQSTARAFYASLGWPDARIVSHMNGIDWSKPVSVVLMPAGTHVSQHVARGAVGNYFAPVGTPASHLGINPAGRVATEFVATRPVEVLRSTAAPITDTWTVSGTAFKAEGGGTQFFTRNKALFTEVR